MTLTRPRSAGVSRRCRGPARSRSGPARPGCAAAACRSVFCTWFCTVRCESTSRSAICLYGQPLGHQPQHLGLPLGQPRRVRPSAPAGASASRRYSPSTSPASPGVNTASPAAVRRTASSSSSGAGRLDQVAGGAGLDRLQHVGCSPLADSTSTRVAGSAPRGARGSPRPRRCPAAAGPARTTSGRAAAAIRTAWRRRRRRWPPPRSRPRPGRGPRPRATSGGRRPPSPGSSCRRPSRRQSGHPQLHLGALAGRRTRSSSCRPGRRPGPRIDWATPSRPSAAACGEPPGRDARRRRRGR